MARPTPPMEPPVRGHCRRMRAGRGRKGPRPRTKKKREKGRAGEKTHGPQASSSALQLSFPLSFSLVPPAPACPSPRTPSFAHYPLTNALPESLWNSIQLVKILALPITSCMIWSNYFISLSLSCLICEMGIIVLLIVLLWD